MIESGSVHVRFYITDSRNFEKVRMIMNLIEQLLWTIDSLTPY